MLCLAFPRSSTGMNSSALQAAGGTFTIGVYSYEAGKVGSVTSRLR
jgi:hypothetical protein